MGKGRVVLEAWEESFTRFWAESGSQRWHDLSKEMCSFPSTWPLSCPLTFTTGAARANLSLTYKPLPWPSAHSPLTSLLFKVDLKAYYYLLTFTQSLLSKPHPSAWSGLAAKYQQGRSSA